jgi:hypothetical protein
MSAEVIAKMRARVAQCRRLADMILDPTARAALLHMADEGEADIAKLEAEAAAANEPRNELPPQG